MNQKKLLFRRIGCAALAIGTLWACSVMAQSASAQEALSSLRRESRSLSVSLLRWEMGDLLYQETLSPRTRLALSQFPLLLGQQTGLSEAKDLSSGPDVPEDNPEGTVLSSEEELNLPPLDLRDNGVAARTIHPSSPGGYVVSDRVYIANFSRNAFSAENLTFPPKARISGDGPQVLILHTHATESYTMPTEPPYEESGYCRTTDCQYNIVRIGDEIATVLAAQGISVLHDRNLYDYPDYNQAYYRAYDAINAHLKQYPSLKIVLDVHRDAISDDKGTVYKVIAQTEQGPAAQLEFVMGSNTDGAPFPGWLDNLSLAASIQQTAEEETPGLMRPIVLRGARYNQQLTPGSLLLEVGSAGNSLDEALLAARLFASAFGHTLLAQKGS